MPKRNGKTIAEHMLDVLRDHRKTAVSGLDFEMIEECAVRAGLSGRHPLASRKAVLDALERYGRFQRKTISHLDPERKEEVLVRSFRLDS